MLKIAENRGGQMVKALFECFMGDRNVLPSDWRELYGDIDSEPWRAESCAIT